ncbi:MAG: DJ-1/PfpI family protein [Treponema sp.]|jgi:4-methyl-5(b-hydroxyethyl)-thiazole monophosphate biosynthesis|nr:DJ-1/PfpI family protein [Treponema sp.]
MAKKALVLLADGFEEVEAVTPVDYLRRAGIEVTVASITENLTVKGARAGLQVLAEIALSNLSAADGGWDAVILPGGMPGAANLAASKETTSLLKNMAAAGKLICAICAAPAVVLAPLGLLAGKKFTCYPGMEEKVTEGTWSDNRVVVDGNLITSRGAGTAGEFSIAVIKALLGDEAGDKIAGSVLL